MSVITLLTDFGIENEYAGVMKGVILSIDFNAVIVDITHNVDSYDLLQTAHIIQRSYNYFPKGSVHIIVVDPGVGSNRAILALEKENHIFLAPDNGVLTLLMDDGIDFLVKVENTNYFLKFVSQTFHGRDIFAPVAAHISKGTVSLKELGTSIEARNTVHLDIPIPYRSGKELIGVIIDIDHFGNLITNIDSKSLEKFCISDKRRKLVIKIGKNKIIGLSSNYKNTKPKRPLAIVGSCGYVEIAVSCDSAKQYFKAAKGNVVKFAQEWDI